MDQAAVAVFLISAESLKSPFIRHSEVPRLLERRSKEGVLFLPVVAQECAWTKLEWLAKYQARPTSGRALASFPKARRESQLATIATEVINRLRSSQAPSSDEKETPGDRRIRPLLHQLERPPADFVGRSQELRELRAAVEKGRPVGIFGMGGRGKTALALKLAAELELI